jgi:hypothetical protein
MMVPAKNSLNCAARASRCTGAPHQFRKSGCRLAIRLDSQTFAAPWPASSDHGAAATGLHASGNRGCGRA